MGDRIEVPLGLSDFEVTGSVVVDGMLEVGVVSTFPWACFHCGSTDVVGHGRHERRIRDQACSFPTVLVWSQQRFLCRDCGRTSRERHPVLLGAKRVTARFDARLACAATAEPWSDIAAREEVSWWRVSDSFDRAAQDLPLEGPPPEVVSLDEAAFRRRLSYHTVLSTPSQRRVINLTEDRDRTAAAFLFGSLPYDWRKAIRVVVIDMHWPFRRAIDDILGPDVVVVADKFHVLRAVDRAADKVRVRHGRKKQVVGRDGGLSRQHNPRFDPAVWNARWLFARRAHNLTHDQRDALEELLDRHPDLRVAWWLKEAFAHVYTASDRSEAQRRLEVWAHHVTQSGLAEFTGLWRNLSHWQDQILNYHDAPWTNGYAEGVNNKIKLIKRRGYGHRNPDRYRNRVLMATSRKQVNPPRIA